MMTHPALMDSERAGGGGMMTHPAFMDSEREGERASERASELARVGERRRG